MAVCECLREEADLRRLVLEVAEDAAKYGASDGEVAAPRAWETKGSRCCSMRAGSEGGCLGCNNSIAGIA